MDDRIWPHTRVTGLLGITYPLIQARMAGGATTPALVAAVSNAGGLGTLGAAYLSPDALREAMRATRRLTDRSFAVNLFVPTPFAVDPRQIARMAARLAPYRDAVGLPTPTSPVPDRYAESFDDQVAAVLDERAPVFSFTFGIPAPDVLRRFKERGVPTCGTATTVREARTLAAAGVDLIVAQGSEAGGHRGAFLGPVDDALIGTMALVPQVVDAVPVPVVAAGGIMDGRGVAAALALGAEGAQLGTAFLACPESAAPPAHKEALRRATDEDTRLTRAISGRAARGIANRLGMELAAPDDAIPPFPIQHTLTHDIRQAAAAQGRAEFLALWAGQAAALAHPTPAGTLVADIAAATAALLTQRHASRRGRWGCVTAVCHRVTHAPIL
jgi:nitronate monooxygenase